MSTVRRCRLDGRVHRLAATLTDDLPLVLAHAPVVLVLQHERREATATAERALNEPMLAGNVRQSVEIVSPDRELVAELLDQLLGLLDGLLDLRSDGCWTTAEHPSKDD